MYNPNAVSGPSEIRVTWGLVWAFMWRAWVISMLIGFIVGVVMFILSAACGLALGGMDFFN